MLTPYRLVVQAAPTLQCEVRETTEWTAQPVPFNSNLVHISDAKFFVAYKEQRH